MKLKKTIVYFMLFAMLLSLAGCGITDGGITGLMSAPRPNNMQTELSKAIENTVGTEIKYIAPSDGSNKSSFILTDLDNDDSDEAVIFYIENESEKQNVNVAVYSCLADGSWELTRSIAGSGYQIDYVEFRDFNDDSYNDILIGWILSDTVRELCAYDLFNQTDEPMFSDSYTESKLFYNGLKFFIFNIYRDKTTSTGTAKISTVSDGTLKTVAHCDMYGGYDSVEQLTYGVVFRGQKAIILDTKLGNTMITQIFRWSDNELQNIFYDSVNGVNPELIRDTVYPCTDIDDDGIMEVPFTTSLPDIVDAPRDLQKTVITGWSSVNITAATNGTVGALHREFFCVMNPNQRYYYIIPSDWISKISVAVSSTDDSMVFYYCDEDERAKLFTLYCLTSEEFNARKQQGNWFELRKQDGKIYAVNMTAQTNSKYADFIGTAIDSRNRLILY